ncbi:hypothetical protein RSSM_05901 [Rhodopirellula sallentina SM41]|uniref:Uncharacterized protein n=1 Tax=Rhodopirellula sallentina SM41 TaxID=1263870 RepID=M5TUF3_9BACT|nr:hypothetical protein RSSM_05901 [Rhodopirellula sallentina SM41]
MLAGGVHRSLSRSRCWGFARTGGKLLTPGLSWADGSARGRIGAWGVPAF